MDTKSFKLGASVCTSTAVVLAAPSIAILQTIEESPKLIKSIVEPRFTIHVDTKPALIPSPNTSPYSSRYFIDHPSLTAVLWIPPSRIIYDEDHHSYMPAGDNDCCVKLTHTIFTRDNLESSFVPSRPNTIFIV